MRLAARLAIAGAASLLALELCIEATSQARVDPIVRQAGQAVDSAAWKKSPPSLEQWLAVRNELLEAAQLDPGNPAIPETLGVLHARRNPSPELLTYSRDYFAKSLALRPSSPYAWASYAQVKYALGQTDTVFEAALLNAATLGSWEPFVQRSLSDLGLAVYDAVQPATRQHVRAVIERGMRSNPLETLRISESRGRLDVACAFAEGNKRLNDTAWVQRCNKERGRK